MSLNTALPTFRLGLLASKDFDSPQLLEDVFGPKVEQISHLFTNGTNPLIEAFARSHGITHTVYPVSGGRGLPASTRDIVDASEAVVIIASPDSKSAEQIAAICAAKAAKDESFTWRLQPYDPIQVWKGRVCKAQEILSCMTREELKDSAWAKQVEGALA